MVFDPDVEMIFRYRAKAVLRQRARSLRNSFPREVIRARSARIVKTLAEQPEIVNARRIALFYPIERRNEVDLRTLDVLLRQRGVEVAYPSIDPETRNMTFRFPTTMEAMADRGLGFFEPQPDAPEAAVLDIIVVPALQVDPKGHRIGYGAGFYDRTLPRFCPPAMAVGVAFDFQLIAEVPITEGDVSLDLIVTDARILDPGTNAG